MQHQVCVRSFSGLEAFSLPISDAVLPDSRSSGRSPESPGLEQKSAEDERRCWTASRQPTHTHSDQQPPSKTSGRESSAAEQPVRRESEGRTGPLHSNSLSLSLPLHVSISFYYFLSLDPVRATKLRLERGAGNKRRTLPDSLLFVSQLLTRLSVSSSHIC